MGSGSGVAMSRGVGCRCGLDPKLLWLWHRPVATALIRSLAWEPPCAVGVALKRQKKKRKEKETKTKQQQNQRKTLLLPPIKKKRQK